MKVLIVEDHVLLAEGLGMVLREEGHEVGIADARSTRDILAATEVFSPDLVLLDLQLGLDIGSAVTLIPHFRSLGAEVVMITAEEDRVRLAECVAEGASGLIQKQDGVGDIIDLLSRAGRGEPLLTPHRRQELMDALRTARAEDKRRLAGFEVLTRSEERVLMALIEGHSAKFIAASTHLALPTVRTHIRGILQKLGVGSQLQAVALARQVGWTPRDT